MDFPRELRKISFLRAKLSSSKDRSSKDKSSKDKSSKDRSSKDRSSQLFKGEIPCKSYNTTLLFTTLRLMRNLCIFRQEIKII